jgi:hypothetical protein
VVYVWVKESAGSMRFVDDIYLNPCPKCGQRIKACQDAGECEEKEEVE